MNTFSFKNVESKLIEQIKNDFKNFIIKDFKNPNLSMLFKTNDNQVISIFKNNTIMFQGNNLDTLLKKYNLNTTYNIQNNKEEIKFKQFNIIGCDEVGVGDFFGPLVTCACYLPKNFEKETEIIKLLKDSKRLTDINIEKIYNLIKNKVKYNVFILENKEYNNLYDQYNNSHILKAICHNNSLSNLIEKYTLLNKTIILDQFVSESKYYEYLDSLTNVIKDITFITKAESKYLAVACASIIARYYFIQQVKLLEKKYNITLPLGASNEVKKLVNNYLEIYKDETRNFIKLHFNRN